MPGAPFYNLSSLGYVENEYLMSGGATEYSESSPWGSDGNWGVSVAQKNVPYTTNLIVRYPTDPAKFNGTVVIEWLNVVTGGDQDPIWASIANEALNDGYAYIGVTPQNVGMGDLKTWDPVRYGSLGDSSDLQSYDIYTQAAEVARANTDGLLGGLTVKHVIGAGDSESAFRVDTYVNAIQPVTHAFDGFLAVGRAVDAAPLGNGLIAASPFGARIRTNNSVPMIQFNTQGDIMDLDAAAARQPDNANLRTWELAGASHIDAHEAEYELETINRDNPTIPAPACVYGTPVEGTGTALDGVNQTNNMPLFEVEDAALADLQNWLVNGVPAPHEPSSISATSLFGLYYIPRTNQYGIAGGGIQMPDAQVPSGGLLGNQRVEWDAERPQPDLAPEHARVVPHDAADRRHHRHHGALARPVPAVRVLHRPRQLDAAVAVPDGVGLRHEVRRRGERGGGGRIHDPGRRRHGDRRRASRPRPAAATAGDRPVTQEPARTSRLTSVTARGSPVPRAVCRGARTAAYRRARDDGSGTRPTSAGQAMRDAGKPREIAVVGHDVGAMLERQRGEMRVGRQVAGGAGVPQ